MTRLPHAANRRIAPKKREFEAPEDRAVFDDDIEKPEKKPARKAKASPRPTGPSPWPSRFQRLYLGLRVVFGVIVFGSVVAGASFGLYRYASRTPRFGIRYVVVEGQRHRTEADVVRLGALDVGRNIFSVDLELTRRAILKDPWIERATVDRKLPNTIFVRVVEREPVAIVSLGGTGSPDGNRMYLASAGGDVWKRLEPGDPTDLVVISGVGGEAEMVRDREGVRSLVKRAQDVAADYERAAPPKHLLLQEVHVSDEGGIHLVVGRDAVVLALGKPPYRIKVERALRVLAEVDRRKGQPTTIFLDNDAHPDRVVARMR